MMKFIQCTECNLLIKMMQEADNIWMKGNECKKRLLCFEMCRTVIVIVIVIVVMLRANDGCIPATNAQHLWCSGNINAFQAFALGSIPGRCNREESFDRTTVYV